MAHFALTDTNPGPINFQKIKVAEQRQHNVSGNSNICIIRISTCLSDSIFPFRLLQVAKNRESSLYQRAD